MQEIFGLMGWSVRLMIVALLLGAAAWGARAQGQVQPAAAPASAIVPVQNPQKPFRKARRVITNDDIDGIGSIYKGAYGPDLSYVNDCDRGCFESVRAAAHIYPSGLQWKKDLLDAIERVKTDGPWQGLLSDFGSVRGKFCMLEQERAEELAREADPRNVTPVEISIEEKYDRLFKVAQADLLNLYDRAQLLRQAHASNGLEIAFMNFQTGRIIGASCYVAPQNRPNWEGNDDP